MAQTNEADTTHLPTRPSLASTAGTAEDTRMVAVSLLKLKRCPVNASAAGIVGAADTRW